MKKINPAWILLIVSLLGYSLAGLAYIHKEFVSKDTFAVFSDKMDMMGNDIKLLIKMQKGKNE